MGSGQNAIGEQFPMRVWGAEIYEERLDRARIFGQEAQFQIGVHQISQITSGSEIALAYANLADSLIETMLDVATQEIERRFGRFDGQIVILGMGKLGSQELTCTSDLDLIVIYDVQEDNIVSDGKKPINATMWYTKLTQSLISALTVPTAEGALFEVDMRLRPSGRKGPVATQFQGFKNYQQNEAWVWEHQALTRARVVAGDADLAQKVTACINDVLQQKRNAKKIKAEVLEMRKRIEAEKHTKNIWDIKTIKGGLIDIEFIIQYLSLVHAHQHSDILQINASRSLDMMHQHKLLDAEAYETLSISLKLYSEISQIIRVTIDGGFKADNIPDGLGRLLLAISNSPDIRYLEQTLRENQAKVLKLFFNLIGEY